MATRSTPVTSLGTPFDPSHPRTWVCRDCGKSGFDRDDIEFPVCPNVRGGVHHGLRFVEPDGTELTMEEHRAKRHALQRETR